MIGALGRLWREVTGEDPDAVLVTGADSVLPGPFRVTEAAATCVAAVTLAAARFLRERGGEPGAAAVDTGHAAEAFRSERHLLVDGASPPIWAPLSGDYPAVDGWVKLHCNYPHHAAAAAAALRVPAERDAFAAATARLPAEEIENDVVAAGGAAAAMRGRAQWLLHPQSAAVGAEPLVALERLGPAEPRPRAAADRPLAGIRVLDLTHVIAGPVCGRVLAAHGADVLHVGAAHLPVVEPLVIDTGFGKRSCFVDLRTEEGRRTLRALVARADVLVQSYRPGALAGIGFGPADLAALSPGIVTVDLSAYGHTGPWHDRRGFDSLVQLSCGIADDGARAAGVSEPHPLPAQALDHGTGWLAAFGVLAALTEQAREGGSWRLRLSLARTAMWLDGLGRTGLEPAATVDVAPLLHRTSSAFGELAHVGVPGELTGAPPRWAHGPHRSGTDAPTW